MALSPRAVAVCLGSLLCITTTLYFFAIPDELTSSGAGKGRVGCVGSRRAAQPAHPPPRAPHTCATGWRRRMGERGVRHVHHAPVRLSAFRLSLGFPQALGPRHRRVRLV